MPVYMLFPNALLAAAPFGTPVLFSCFRFSSIIAYRGGFFRPPVNFKKLLVKAEARKDTNLKGHIKRTVQMEQLL